MRVTDIRVEDSGDVLGRYKSNANADEKAKERAQPGLKRLRKFFELGGELIPIKNSEIYELKRRSNASDFASLKLIGFKNKSAVPYHYTLDASYFCYPNEDMVLGSTEAFAYLHQSMLKQKVVGIGELLVRKTATSYLVAIYAIQERVASEDADEVGRLISPPGWVVRLLPYEDEMRTLDASNDASFTDEDLVQAALPGVIDKMSDLISHMHLAYKEVGVDFKNQHIEKFWDYVEAIALEEGREADDYRINPLDDKETLADLTRRAKAVSHLLPEDPPKETKKRGNEKISADVDTNWENHLDNLHKFTKKDLVLGLKKYNCPVSGNKNALAERLREAIHSSLNGGG